MKYTGRCWGCNARTMANGLCPECRLRERRGIPQSMVRLVTGALKVRVDDKRTRSVRDRRRWGEDETTQKS
jgi:hypothetical protein